MGVGFGADLLEDGVGERESLKRSLWTWGIWERMNENEAEQHGSISLLSKSNVSHRQSRRASGGGSWLDSCLGLWKGCVPVGHPSDSLRVALNGDNGSVLLQRELALSSLSHVSFLCIMERDSFPFQGGHQEVGYGRVGSSATWAPWWRGRRFCKRTT